MSRVSQNYTPRNKWTLKQRTALCLMVGIYDNTWDEYLGVFSFMFQNQLIICGLKDGLPKSTLITQYHDLCSRKKLTLVNINYTNFATRIFKLSLEIQRAASTIGIAFTKKEDVNILLLPPNWRHWEDFNNEKQPLQPPIAMQPLHVPNHSSGPVPPPPPTPPSLSVNILPSPPVTPNRCSRRVRNPRIAFRAWGHESQGINIGNYFCAGMWQSDPRVVPPPSECDPRMFAAMARSHLSRFKINSPFISVYTGALAAIHRAFRTPGSSITIFDLSLMDTTRVFFADELLRDNPLSTEVTRRYVGFGEILIWGDIPNSAILGTMSTSELEALSQQDMEVQDILRINTIKSFEVNRWPLKRRLASANVPVNRQTGEIVGRVLYQTGVARERAGEIAILFSKSWFFKKRRGYKEFLEGVDSSFDQPSQETRTADTSRFEIIDDDKDDARSDSSVTLAGDSSDIEGPSESPPFRVVAVERLRQVGRLVQQAPTELFSTDRLRVNLILGIDNSTGGPSRAPRRNTSNLRSRWY